MKTAKAEELDRMFDEGEDMYEYVDLSTVAKVNKENETRRVNVDFPAWMISGLDEEASALGISRQAVIKVWVGERLREKQAS